VENTIREMKDKKSAGDENVPGEVLTLVGGNGLRIVTTLIKNIYETREWHQGVYPSYNDCLKEEPKSYKMQRPSHKQAHCTIQKK
jgi:hypothetical protein